MINDSLGEKNSQPLNEMKIQSNKSNDMANKLKMLGTTEAKKGNFDMAIKYYREALEIYQKGEDKGSVQYATTLYNLGITYEKIDSLYQSLEAFEKAYAIRVLKLGAHDIKTQNSKNNMQRIRSKL